MMLLLDATCCRRDEALAAIQESIRAQQQQELAIETEIQGYKKDINKEQVCMAVSSSSRWRAGWHLNLDASPAHDSAGSSGVLFSANMPASEADATSAGLTWITIMAHSLLHPCLPCLLQRADQERAAERHRAQGAGRERVCAEAGSCLC
jgi:hypothetical protein